MRVVEWLVLAGLIGVARRSLTGFLLIGGWFAAFVVTKGAWGGANIYGGSVFRIMMPSFPAFVLMLASLVFLWPRGRKGRRPALPAPRSSLRPRTRLSLLGAAVLVFAVFPLVVIAAAQPLHGPEPPAYEADVLLRPVDPALKLTAVRIGRPRPPQLERLAAVAGEGLLPDLAERRAERRRRLHTRRRRKRRLLADDGRRRSASRRFVGRPSRAAAGGRTASPSRRTGSTFRATATSSRSARRLQSACPDGERAEPHLLRRRSGPQRAGGAARAPAPPRPPFSPTWTGRRR